MSEPVKKETRQMSGGEQENEQQGGLTMTAPVFQLQASAAAPPAAPAEGGGDLPAEYLAHLRLREGFREDVYLDTRGFPTAGVGHLLSAAERRQYPVGTRVPRATLDAWLARDARGAYDAAVSQAGQLNVTSQAFINALGAVNFQLGTGWTGDFPRTWALMRAHQWEQAAREAADSAWNTQTPVRVRDFQAALRALIGGTTGGNTTGNQTGGNHAAPPVVNAPAAQPIARGTISGNDVNVRSGPGTNHATVGSQLDRGANVSIFERRDGWLRIGTGRWVKAQFVREANAAPTKDGQTKQPVVQAPPTSGQNAAPTGGQTTTPAPGARVDLHQVTISASVGAGGRNVRADVTKIQQLLKDLGYRMTVNGTAGKMTTGAIAAFQEASGIASDGRVDPGGNTLRTMNSTPNGAFHNTAEHTREDDDAPKLTHSRWTNKGHFLVDTAGEAVPRQFYSNMSQLITNMNTIADNLRGTFNVNCGYRSPYYNSTLEGSAAQSNHQFGRAVDIAASNYTPTQLREQLRRLITEGKIHAGGIGLYSWGCHYDIDNRREW